MENKRSIKELLILLRDKAWVYYEPTWFGLTIKPRILAGLCWEANSLYTRSLISSSELDYIKDYIENNMPRYWLNKRWGWKPTYWTPRLKWLNKHIESLSNLN